MRGGSAVAGVIDSIMGNSWWGAAEDQHKRRTSVYEFVLLCWNNPKLGFISWVSNSPYCYSSYENVTNRAHLLESNVTVLIKLLFIFVT